MAGGIRGPDEPDRRPVRGVEPRRRVRQLVLGLLSDLPRKNCWTIAEWVGENPGRHAAPARAGQVGRADQVRDSVPAPPPSRPGGRQPGRSRSWPRCRCTCAGALLRLLARTGAADHLVRVAGSRWRVDEFFQFGKGLATPHPHPRRPTRPRRRPPARLVRLATPPPGPIPDQPRPTTSHSGMKIANCGWSTSCLTNDHPAGSRSHRTRAATTIPAR